MQICFIRSSMGSLNGSLLRSYGTIQQVLYNRWIHLNPRLLEYVMRQEGRPGQVYLDHPCLSRSYKANYGNILGVQRFQTMRNTASPKINLERGRCYVSVGFVDLQQLLEADVVGSEDTWPAVWWGYEVSPIAVARAKLVLVMLEDGVPAKQILQVWYSASISPEAAKNLQRCCRLLAGREQDPEQRTLLECWGRASLGQEEASARWAQVLGSNAMMTLNQLASKTDRIDYVRYLFTGQVFVPESSTKTGNPTFFCLPEGYNNTKMDDENIFRSINTDSLDYKESLKITVEKKFEQQLEKLRRSLTNGQLVVTVEVRKLVPDNYLLCQEIQKMSPARIDWSNVPDYLAPQDFFDMARQCSVAGTQHTMHLMNWVGKTFGCELFDYVPYDENYGNKGFSLHNNFQDSEGITRKLVQGFVKELQAMISTRPTPDFLKLNLDLMIEADVAQAVLCHRFIDAYMTFMFEGQKLSAKHWKLRRFSLLAKVRSVTDVSLTFAN